VALALLGVYGVMAYSVAQRSHEFGIRMALGAPRPAIMRLVMGAGLRLVALGTLLGLLASFISASVLRSLIFGVSPISGVDPIGYLMVILLLIAGAGLASYLPALRAMRVDPMVALRYE
jgi:putative ABC transport system permease protein